MKITGYPAARAAAISFVAPVEELLGQGDRRDTLAVEGGELHVDYEDRSVLNHALSYQAVPDHA